MDRRTSIQALTVLAFAAVLHNSNILHEQDFDLLSFNGQTVFERFGNGPVRTGWTSYLTTTQDNKYYTYGFDLATTSRAQASRGFKKYLAREREAT